MLKTINYGSVTSPTCVTVTRAFLAFLSAFFTLHSCSNSWRMLQIRQTNKEENGIKIPCVLLHQCCPREPGIVLS